MPLQNDDRAKEHAAYHLLLWYSTVFASDWVLHSSTERKVASGCGLIDLLPERGITEPSRSVAPRRDFVSCSVLSGGN